MLSSLWQSIPKEHRDKAEKALLKRTWRRGLVVGSGLVLFTVWNGFEHSYRVSVRMIKAFKSGQAGWWLDLDGFRLFGMLMVCFVLAWGVLLLFERYFVREFGRATTLGASQGDANALLLVSALRKIGVVQVFPTYDGQPIAQQPYADAIRREVEKSEWLGILSMASFELIGKGNQSLCYAALSGKPSKMVIDAILLDPSSSDGQKTIERRAQALAKKDPDFDTSEFTRQVKETVKKLHGLKAHEVRLRYIDIQPPFRLVIGDKHAFVSCYTDAQHGHLSDVFRVEKKEGEVGWYESFRALFEYYKSTRPEQPRLPPA